MGSAESLHCLLLEVTSQQLVVLQGPTEAEGFSLGNSSSNVQNCCHKNKELKTRADLGDYNNAVNTD